MPDFEQSFSEFLDSSECEREHEKMQSTLFSMVRMAFESGWRAACANSPKPHKVIELVITPDNE